MSQMPLFHRSGGMMLTTKSSEFSSIHDAAKDDIAIQYWQSSDIGLGSSASASVTKPFYLLSSGSVAYVPPLYI
eukprot:m.1150086 g.1150086  ORF g.1150086 m.1150086 type:complete len:74 (-) comp24477_c0_seq2:1096-1317(-)